ncbi:hypothetical protein Q6A73_08425 [Aliarcobacter skirrowii]|uniref:hypothetical protein n=1 Tax=Aliarcobacter skirrowii TaxID=28200 RepID=UPI0029A4B4DA|nr:hypothetical protein [Aliarcobacter skirrowii]MDX4026626.1 hypothetical protein [Aliarcobacter skirrowii]
MKIIKYTIIAIFLIVVSKWILTLLPSSYSHKDTIIEKTETSIKVEHTFKNLRSDIRKDFDNVEKDINSYIEEKIGELNRTSKYNLSKEDGFLDWFFGWWTGYQMVYYKVKGHMGFEDNEIKLVEEKFSEIVFEEDELEATLDDINKYSKQRVEDFYKSTFQKILDDVEKSQGNIQDYKIENINSVNLPWGKYLTQLGTNSFELATAFGVGATVSAVIGAKVGTIIGPKVLGIVTAKVATVVAGKIATLSSLIFAPIVDYALNEGVKAFQIDDTRRDFENAIDDITQSVEKIVKDEYSSYILELKKEIDEELDKTIILKGTK